MLNIQLPDRPDLLFMINPFTLNTGSQEYKSIDESIISVITCGYGEGYNTSCINQLSFLTYCMI